jgi:hypothetical protein
MAALVLPSGWTDAKYGLLAFAFVGELVQGEEGEEMMKRESMMMLRWFLFFLLFPSLFDLFFLSL